MESLYLTVSIFLLLGKTEPYAEAVSIFDPITNIFEPVRHESTPAKVINSFLSPFRGSSEVHGPEFHHHKGRNHRNSKAWWDNNEATPLIQNIFNDMPTEKSYHDKKKSHEFAEPTDILNKINEMKDQEKKTEIDQVVEDTQTPNPPDFVDHTPSDKHSGEEKGDVTSKVTTQDGKKILRAITKKHFYFQAQPVRPVGESKRMNETVYYVDN